eukprot:Lankesteria_metandrocarpae@DN5178_c0_g1_i5.p1
MVEWLKTSKSLSKWQTNCHGTRGHLQCSTQSYFIRHGWQRLAIHSRPTEVAVAMRNGGNSRNSGKCQASSSIQKVLRSFFLIFFFAESVRLSRSDMTAMKKNMHIKTKKNAAIKFSMSGSLSFRESSSTSTSSSLQLPLFFLIAPLPCTLR